MKTNQYSVPFMVSLAQNSEKISEQRFYRGDISASDLLMDLEILIKTAEFTDKQLFILNHYWIQGYTQEDVADKLGITQQMVEKHTRAIKKKIDRVLQKWGEI